MNEDLKKLYELIGVAAPDDGDVSFSTLEASANHEPPPLDAEGLDQLEQALNKNPRLTLARVREGWHAEVTEKQLREAIAHARRALAEPSVVVAELEAMSFGLTPLPAGFTFEGMDLDEIPIDLGDHKFENDDLVSALGWVFGAGPFVLTRPDKKNFRFHNQPPFTSDFIYPLEDPQPGQPLEIALFSDFGVGRYYSKYIAKQFRTRRFPYAIHCGDIYYSGRKKEIKEYFEDLIDPILADTSVFALNSNHEMYSGGVPYLESITRRKQLQPGKQKQEGSYFCLRSQRFQIVGIDTAFFGHGRYRDEVLKEWLAARLREGRELRLVNILLSADHPYELGDRKLTKLLDKDLRSLALGEKLVDLWFWGNTHYCALYNASEALPFVGSCIGHGGYPYDKLKIGIEQRPQPAPLAFLEKELRFPSSSGINSDRGNNGYCVMSLNADGSIGLKYIDWMSNPRFAANLKRAAAGQPLTVTQLDL